MKKIIGIIITITVAIILVGCSSTENGANNGVKPNVNDTTSENTSISSDQESQSEDTATEIKDINNN